MSESSDFPALETWLGEAQTSIDGILSGFVEVAERIRDAERRTTTERFHGVARRLHSAASRRERINAVQEAAATYGVRSGVADIQKATIRLPNGQAIALGEAPAIANAAESKDIVVTACTPGELSPLVIEMLGGPGANIWLFPLVSRRGVEAVLFLEPHPERFDGNSVELICALAGPWLEEAAPEPKPGNLIAITSASGKTSRSGRPEWSDLPAEEQGVHLRAQRFARTRVSEFIVHRRHQVEAGRHSGDLYRELREEIDAGRDSFQRQFSGACPSMVDYFHLELVRTLARGDEAGLGPEYPGPVR